MTCSCHLSEMVGRYDPMVRCIVSSRVGWNDELEDVVQEVWAKATARMASLRHPDRAGAWLARIAATTALDWVRRRASRERCLHYAARDPSPWLSGGTFGGSCEPELDMILKSVHDLVERLPDRERRVVQMHYYQGLSCSRIGRQEGRSRTAIRWRLARARALLRAALEERDHHL